MNNTLICYFSASGNTKTVAEELAKITKGDLFEIEPKEKYIAEDLDWTDKDSRSSKEMNEGIKPEIVKNINNLDNYNRILLGFPVWWYKAPTIIDTFLEGNDLTNKEIYVFVTSGSSSVDGSLTYLKETYPNLNFVSGKRFSTNPSEEDITSWIN